jgi:hypothetical protein
MKAIIIITSAVLSLIVTITIKFIIIATGSHPEAIVNFFVSIVNGFKEVSK